MTRLRSPGTPHASEPAGPLQPGELRNTLLLAAAVVVFLFALGLFCALVTS